MLTCIIICLLTLTSIRNGDRNKALRYFGYDIYSNGLITLRYILIIYYITDLTYYVSDAVFASVRFVCLLFSALISRFLAAMHFLILVDVRYKCKKIFIKIAKVLKLGVTDKMHCKMMTLHNAK